MTTLQVGPGRVTQDAVLVLIDGQWREVPPMSDTLKASIRALCDSMLAAMHGEVDADPHGDLTVFGDMEIDY